ncbi:MAG: L,D-transpeptidase family protein [Promethearchaeota archaeon]
MKRAAFISFLVLFVASHSYASGAFPLDDPARIIIGATETYIIKDKETLIELARKYDIGYNEIVAANNNIDPWVPEKGTKITIPTSWLIPEVLDKGIVINLAEMRLYYFFNIDDQYESRLIYTIQIESRTNSADAHEQFNTILQSLNKKDLNLLRIEKVGEYHTVRLGKFKHYATAKKFLKAIKPKLSRAIILKAYIKNKRIIKLYTDSLSAKELGVKEKSLSNPASEKIKGRATEKSDKKIKTDISVEKTRFVRTFPLGIGRQGFNTPTGTFTVTAKVKDPVWYVPEHIRNENPELPPSVPPGPNNPLGGFWIQLSINGYGLHGTTRPYGIGRRVSHGCMRLYPEDIKVLFNLLEKGIKVKIIDEPVKIGRLNKKIYAEIHRSQKEDTQLVSLATLKLFRKHMLKNIDTQLFINAIKSSTGLPAVISK